MSTTSRSRARARTITRQGRDGTTGSGADRYFQQDVKDQMKLAPEGVYGQAPYHGADGCDHPPPRRRLARRHGLCRGGDDP